MKPKRLATIAVIVAFVGFLAWTTLSAQKVSCNVCVEYNGRTNCAAASHSDSVEAARSAQTTACGPLTSGMNETIACGNRPAISKECHSR